MDKLTSHISTLFYIHGLNAHKDKQFHRLKMTLNKSLRIVVLKLLKNPSECQEERLNQREENSSSICVFSPTMAAK